MVGAKAALLLLLHDVVVVVRVMLGMMRLD
jgi:hypothetical protein